MQMVKPRPDLRQLRESKRLSVEDVVVLGGPVKQTVLNIEHGIEVSFASLAKYAMVFSMDPESLVDRPVLPPLTPMKILSWMVRKTGPVQTAANGLQWRVCELEHELLPSARASGKVPTNKRSRAKLYDLSEFADDSLQWEKKMSYLHRHAKVCSQIGEHPNIARNNDAFQHPNDRRQYWVLDEWIDDSQSLDERLTQGPLRGEDLMRCMNGMAKGLQVLHQQGIVRRELSPKFVQLSPSRVVLTDFELAMLLDGSPTVRPQDRSNWSDDIYVAPEANDQVKDPNRTQHVNGATSWDLFSWAMILAHAVTGQSPLTVSGAGESIREANLPSPLVRFAMQCLRPQSHRDEEKRRPSMFPPQLDSMLTTAGRT
jgi:serine/threonine protein kinase